MVKNMGLGKTLQVIAFILSEKNKAAAPSLVVAPSKSMKSLKKRRDIDLYRNIKFQYCFLDEAQHIKNPNTLNARTAKQINSEMNFALTGTPIENSITELWSIFRPQLQNVPLFFAGLKRMY